MLNKLNIINYLGSASQTYDEGSIPFTRSKIACCELRPGRAGIPMRRRHLIAGGCHLVLGGQVDPELHHPPRAKQAQTIDALANPLDEGRSLSR
jgi:hypothetical protein